MNLRWSRSVLPVVGVVLMLAMLVVPVMGAMSSPMNARDLTGTNMPGIDHGNTVVNSEQECAELCAATAGCEGATYVLPNTIQGPNAHCWRKSAVTGDVENFNCISFLKQASPPGGSGCSGVTPIADFSALFSKGWSTPHAVKFKDRSTGAVSWAWDFGDMTTGPESTQQNPIHTYTTGSAQGLLYTVKLTITGSCPGQTDTKTRVGYVTVFDNIGVLNLTSVPDGARFFLDSQDLGTTPYINIVPEGPHTVRLTLSGYNDYTAPVTIVKNQQNTMTATMVKVATPPAPAAGTLQITTTPDGAAVYVDGGTKGMSPVTLSGLAAGSHTVSLKKAGYTEYQGTLTLATNKTTLLNITLVAAPGTTPTTPTSPQVPTGATSLPATQTPSGTGNLTVLSTPAGATAWLDGKNIGTTPVRVPGVAPGTHRLLLTLQGYNDIPQVVNIIGGMENEATADFTAGKKTPGFAVPVSLAALALVVLALAGRRKGR